MSLSLPAPPLYYSVAAADGAQPGVGCWRQRPLPEAAKKLSQSGWRSGAEQGVR